MKIGPLHIGLFTLALVIVIGYLYWQVSMLNADMDDMYAASQYQTS